MNVEKLRDQVNIGIERQCATLLPDPNRVQKVLRAANKGNNTVTRRKLYVSIILALTAVMLSVTAIAAGVVMGRIVRLSYSFVIPEYTKMPTNQECVEAVGYVPALINTFKNGYTFKGASIKNNTLKTDSEDSVETYKSITFYYTKETDVLILSAQQIMPETESADSIIKIVDGISIHYTSFVNKFVPEDYEMTNEDKEAVSRGELVFSYGTTRTVEVSTVQVVYFETAGIKYVLTQIDGSASVEELVSIAEEII